MDTENIWAMDLMSLRGMMVMGYSPTFAAARRSWDRGYKVHDGVAVIQVIGIMSKRGIIQQTREAISKAVKDDRVKSIAFVIDSPGGSVSGTKDLAGDIAAAGQVKMTGAYIEDMGASAAYWIASQAKYVAANESALVGSIGMYGIVYDTSERAKKDGLKVHIVRAGEFKGSAIPGTAISKECLNEYQRIIESLNQFFVQDVSRGRNLGQARAARVADGRIHIAGEAKALGLIDETMTFPQFLKKLV